MTPLIGIVTVLFNSDSVLPGFFESLSRQTGIRYKLYVIDNSPKDGGSVMSRSLAKRYGIDADVCFNNANRGVAAGNNQGIKAALADHCELVLLSNNDVEFGPTTIAMMQGALGAGGDCAAVPKIMYYDEPKKFWYAGGHFNLWKGTTSHDGEGHTDGGQYDKLSRVQYAPTCFMLVRADVFGLVGLMDETYFVYYDDTDFIWRLRAHDQRIRFVPSARVLHKVSSLTGGAKSPFSVYYGNRNRIYFIIKNMHGVQRCAALLFTVLTRIPRFATMRASAARSGMRGIADGFRIALRKQRHHPATGQ